MDKQHVKPFHHNRNAENDPVARPSTNIHGDAENLLALLRPDYGRCSIQGSKSEKFSRYTSNEPETPRKLLDINRLEEMYGLKQWTVRSYCSQRKIPFIKIGRRVFFDPAAIDAWIKAHERPVEEVDIP